jgi:hypothetical protein
MDQDVVIPISIDIAGPYNGPSIGHTPYLPVQVENVGPGFGMTNQTNRRHG